MTAFCDQENNDEILFTYINILYIYNTIAHIFFICKIFKCKIFW